MKGSILNKLKIIWKEAGRGLFLGTISVSVWGTEGNHKKISANIQGEIWTLGLQNSNQSRPIDRGNWLYPSQNRKLSPYMEGNTWKQLLIWREEIYTLLRISFYKFIYFSFNIRLKKPKKKKT